MQVNKNSIFISYRRDDSADVTGRIYDRLVQEFGRETVFKDVDSIPLGLDFQDYLSDMVGQCEVVLVVIGKQWLTVNDPTTGQRRLDNPSDFVVIEIAAALERNIRVIPLLVQYATMPTAKQLPDRIQKLSYRNGTAIKSDPDFHADMDRLIRGIKEIFGPKESVTPAKSGKASTHSYDVENELERLRREREALEKEREVLAQELKKQRAEITRINLEQDEIKRKAEVKKQVELRKQEEGKRQQEESLRKIEQEQRQCVRISEDSRYKKSRVGVILDTKTNLEWFVGPDQDTTWDEAKYWTDSLTVDGGAWRMPTIEELRGLYQEGKGLCNMDTIFVTTGFWVWSCNDVTSSSARGFTFHNGLDYSLTRSPSRRARIFCVRGGQL